MSSQDFKRLATLSAIAEFEDRYAKAHRLEHQGQLGFTPLTDSKHSILDFE